MARMTIRISDEKHKRMRDMAADQDMSLNSLVVDMSTALLSQYDIDLRFQTLAAKGNPALGEQLLNKLDNILGPERKKKI